MNYVLVFFETNAFKSTLFKVKVPVNDNNFYEHSSLNNDFNMMNKNQN